MPVGLDTGSRRGSHSRRMASPESSSRAETGSSSREWRLRAALVTGVSLVFLPVLLHPTQVIYNDVSDLLSGHEPYRHLMVQSLLERGRLPLYDPTAFGGIPLASDPQTGNGYPPNWLHVVGGAATYGWLIWLHVCVGGLGVLWWLREDFPASVPRLAAAFTFALAGKWLVHVVSAGHVIFLALAWLPWQLGWIDRIARAPGLLPCAMLALSTALAVVGLHPQLLLYSQTLVAGYVVCVALRRDGAGRMLLACGAAGALALALSASHLLPVIAALDLYVRGEALSYVEAAWRSLSPSTAIGMLLPSAVGGAWEEASFVGVAALALALFAPWSSSRRRLVGFAAGAFVACLWYALGGLGGPTASPVGALHHLLFLAVPGFDLFRLPVRVLLLAGLPLAVLAAAGLDALEKRRTPAMQGLALALSVLGLFLAVGWRTPDALWALVALAAPSLCLLPGSARLHGLLVGLVAAIVFVDGARYAAPLVRTRPLDEILGHNAVVDLVSAPLGRGRVLALNGDARPDFSSLPPTYTTRADIESLRGYNPLVPRATHDFLIAGAAGREPERRRGASTIPSFSIASRAHLDLFNTRWVVSHQPLSVEGLELRRVVRGQQVFLFQRPGDRSRPRDVYVHENVRRMPRAALVRKARRIGSREEAIAEITRLDPRREVLVEVADLVGSYPGGFQEVPVTHHGDAFELSVDAGEGGYLLLSEIAYPGWRAEDGGTPVEIHRANAIFQVVRLGRGRHDLRFRYRPASWDAGVLITGGAVLTVAAMLVIGRRRTQRGRDGPNDFDPPAPETGSHASVVRQVPPE